MRLIHALDDVVAYESKPPAHGQTADYPWAGAAPIAGRVIHLTGNTLLFRVLACLTARLRTRLARRSLRHSGYPHMRQFAVFPDVASPRLVFELGTSAAIYAERHLLPRTPHALRRTVGAVVAWFSGVDPRIAAVVIVGWR